MKKIRLLTPGPTPVPERLSLRMARPIVHHRSPEFEAVFARVREGLSWLFQTKQDVLVFASSGTGAMEASFVNFLRKGDTAIVVDGGKFEEPLDPLQFRHQGRRLKVRLDARGGVQVHRLIRRAAHRLGLEERTDRLDADPHVGA